MFVSCGDNKESAPASTDDAEELQETQAPVEEEEPSACLGQKKGPVVELQTGKANGDNIERVTFYPHDLRLPAGRFVTIKITNPSSTLHDFAAESLDCQTRIFRPGEMVMVSFRVPPGETDFVCTIHDTFMTGNIIGKK